MQTAFGWWGLVAALMVLTWLGLLTFFVVRLMRKFSQLFARAGSGNIDQLLQTVAEEIKKKESSNQEIKEKLAVLARAGQRHLQKVGLIRYNPFADTGGNQSFVLALLDHHGSGFVITSLHSRDSTRVFAKPVKEGKEAGFEFSKEEIQAIVAAQKTS